MRVCSFFFFLSFKNVGTRVALQNAMKAEGAGRDYDASLTVLEQALDQIELFLRARKSESLAHCDPSNMYVKKWICRERKDGDIQRTG